MKILVIHTYYQHHGGEDSVFQQEQDLIKQYHEVKVLAFHNKSGLIGALDFTFYLWNVFANKKLKQVLTEFQPDIVHIHNLHFAIGPIIIKTIKNAGIPVVVTLHNYRMLCPSATLIHHSKLFTNSLKVSFPWKAIGKKVYRDSLFQTFWVALVNIFHRKMKTWEKVDRYIVLTEFARQLFINSTFGVEANRFVIKPNFVDLTDNSCSIRGKHFLFIGRLSEEKGITTLLDAFRYSSYELHIAGNGPLADKVLRAQADFSNIHYLGSLDKESVLTALRKCTALVFPSIWFEGMPMTIIEAFATSTPVIASNLGAMKYMICNKYNGLHFETGNSTSLISQLQYWNETSQLEKERFNRNAKITYKQNYTSKINQKALFNIYTSLLNKD